MNDMRSVIVFSEVTMCFGHKKPWGGDRKTVLDRVNLSVPSGRILCLLGPSGCGKTTMVNLIMGMLVPTQGSVRVMGEVAPYPTARAHTGFMPQDSALYEDVTAEENLRFFGTLYGLRGKCLSAAIDEVFAFTRLENDRRQLVNAFSGGMKRRLSLGIAMLASPDLLVLDEPTVGLDPEHRHLIWDRFRQLAQRGTTLLVTTHIMDEAERCDEVALLREGSLLAQGTPNELMERTNTKTMEDAFLASACVDHAFCEEAETSHA